jgi:NADH-quinone oxidoreductase subunit L
MVMGMGVGAYDMALFHLVTHAFFKAGLFLAVGVVIHQMAHSGNRYVNMGFIPPTQDLHNMGAFRYRMPRTFILYLIPMLALAGIPFFSGFLSKDGILLAAWERASALGGISWMIPVLGFLTAGLTALYMARHAMLIFGGKARQEKGPKDPSFLMLFPLGILALGSLGIVFSLNPFDGASSWLLEMLPIPEVVLPEGLRAVSTGTGAAHIWIASFSTLLALGGLGLGYFQFRGGFGSDLLPVPNRLKKIAENHFYLDSLYYHMIVRPGLWIATKLEVFDRKILDGLVQGISAIQVHGVKELPSISSLASTFDEQVIDGIVHRLVNFIGGFGKRLRTIQSGQLQQYLIWGILIMGVFFVMTYILFLG